MAELPIPDIPVITLEVARFRTKKQEKLLAMLNDNRIKKEVNTRIKDAINEFVPKKTGALRASARAYPDFISWGDNLPQYARYQYYGEVYGPNIPITRGGQIVGWYSRPGRQKHPTGRELGVPGYWRGWRFGYTKKGTHHHWDQYFKYFPKLKTNIEITRFLKRECKKRGLKT